MLTVSRAEKRQISQDKIIGVRQTYEAVARVIMTSATNWATFANFYEIVMRNKEEREMER